MILHPKQSTKWLIYIREHPWVLGQATGTLDHKTHHGWDSREATTFPHIIFCAPHFGGGTSHHWASPVLWTRIREEHAFVVKMLLFLVNF